MRPGHRAFTLTEVLMALVLLGAVTVAIAALTGGAARMEHEARPRLEFECELDALFAAIRDDVQCGDLPEGLKDPKVTIAGNDALVIRTRDRGAVTRTYRYASTTKQVHVDDRRQGGSLVTSGDQSRVVLDGVEEWSCSIDEELRVLTVLIRGEGLPERQLKVRIP